MVQLNRGVVYTNDNCIGCNKCISVCPVLGANVSTNEKGIHRIVVDGDKCIQCGNCIRSCQHAARFYRDDTALFLNDLRNGESVSLVIAPSFFASYKSIWGRVISYLRFLGVSKIYNGSIGADIALWATLATTDKEEGPGRIQPTCPALVNYIKKYETSLLEHLSPVRSRSECAAVYVRKYLKNTDKLALLSPCIAEISNADRNQYQYFLTYEKLLEGLEDNFESLEDGECDEIGVGFGTKTAVPGGEKEMLEYFSKGDTWVATSNGCESLGRMLSEYMDAVSADEDTAKFLCGFTCPDGCIRGTGFENEKHLERRSLKNLHDMTTSDKYDDNGPYGANTRPKERRLKLDAQFKKLTVSDFVEPYKEEETTNQSFDIRSLDSIFTSMHKISPQDRRIDCGNCGYKTCREMAEAISFGINHKENCVHYVREENKRLYLIDPLTGLPNINYYYDTVRRKIAERAQRMYTAFYLNLKDTSFVNERYGYDAGDEIIRKFAGNLMQLRKDGDFFARLGADNFVGIIKNENVETFLDKIGNVVIKPDGEILEENYRVYSNIGLYALTGDEKSPKDLMEKVSIAFAMSRKSNVSYQYYDDRLKEDLVNKMVLMRQLPEAIKNGELLVYFQPKVSTETLKIVGAEALVRWNKDGKVVSPADFIPICETTGLVTDIDFYVLEHTCKKMWEWMHSGMELVRISVNFSKQHFKKDDVAERIYEVISRYAIPTEYIEVEFTETAYLDREEVLEQTLEKLRSYGIVSSIDDFGSGYSSINLLQNMNFEIVKLDKSLLGKNVQNPKTQKVISNIIHMAKELEMEVLAEGVETHEELDILKELKCDIVQGYLFDKPLPEDVFEERLCNSKTHYTKIQLI